MLSALKDCLESVACPTCSSKVILTKEKVLFCQTCYVGYPMAGDVPDFRAQHVINFKKIAFENKTGVRARFVVPAGKSLKDSFELTLGHCLVLGRAARLDPESDITYFGMNETGIALGSHTLQLIEKYLAKSRSLKGQDLPEAPQGLTSSLAGFKRDQDVFLDDKSVSRAHAIFYQDDEGVFVMDLVSKNGTYLNGREIERARIKHNDVVSLGTVSLKVKLRG